MEDLENLLTETLRLAAACGADMLDLLYKMVESAEEHEDQSMTIDPEVVYEARNFLANFRREPTNKWMN